jgi:hypothetical protein
MITIGISQLTFSVFFVAGVGTREYYRKLGYQLDGPYMSKRLSDDYDDYDDEAFNCQ